MIVRSIVVGDIPSLTEMWNEAGLETKPTGRESGETLGRYVSENPDLCLCAEQDGIIVGCVIGSDDGRKGWFNRLATRPSHRKSGVARALTTALEDALRKRGRQVFAATIFKDNAASMELFKSAGFEPLESLVYLRKADSEDA